MEKISVVEYSPSWKTDFQKAKSFYRELLQDIESKVEHVGSTAVEGMWAKPILDIDIIVINSIDNGCVIELLTGVGYVHLGNLGITGREAFTSPKNNPRINWMEHHLYVCIKGSENLNNHLLLRKHLRNNIKAVEAYSKLKRKLAKEFTHDIDAYVEGKSGLIAGFLRAEGMDQDSIKRISSINKKE